MTVINKDQIKNEHDDIVIKFFVDYIYEADQITEETCKSYLYYFAQNPDALERLTKTVNKYVTQFLVNLLEKNKKDNYVIFEDKILTSKKTKNDLLKKYSKQKNVKDLLEVSLVSALS